MDNSDGTLTSDTSGLMWLQNAGLGTFTWDGAFSYISDFNAGIVGDNAGYNDWRLSGGSNCNSRATGTNCFGSETFDLFWELLIEHSTGIYSEPASPFENGVAGDYWTSFEIDADYAYSVNFSLFGPDGAQMDYLKTNEFNILLVRDPNGTNGDNGGTSVPEPSVIALFGVGLVGFGFARRKIRK